MLKMYRLVCKDPRIKEIYIGSTKQPLYKRYYEHKKSCYNEKEKCYNYYVYQFIRENGGIENFEMIEIERYDREVERTERLQIERLWLEFYEATLNTRMPWVSEDEAKEKNNQRGKQNYLDNKDKIKEKTKQHYLDNKEKIKEYASKKVECDLCGKCMRRDSILRHKKRRHKTE